MDTIATLIDLPSLVLTAGLVVLSFSAVKKLWANLTIRTGKTELVGLEVTDWLAISTEVIVIGIGTWAPLPYSNMVVALYFLALLVVAFLLRGTQCNCFGISENVIDIVHISLLAIISMANVMSIFIDSPAHSTRSVLLGLLAGGVILIIWQQKRPSSRTKAEHSIPPEQEVGFESVSGITVFTQQGCNSCRVLKSVLEDRDFFIPLIFEDEKHSSLVRTHRISSFPTALVHFSDRPECPQTLQLNGVTEIIGFLAKGRA
mgnify:FL=1